ncbi:penicillin-binding protein 2 [Bacillus sp. FJAT-42376]|uniref:peptidoglycan D,D-transpeptidase FtsI family protein n=1 Tax=Bacillus sp. FJAT-42376 TaxID=2014076 RepID=UPI000F4FEB53|nr:penicillin-binding protein 2 [Bacillus sp. FJAT-42376]AZB44401.1 penicillin-binding protein 2 [Bacillus sp. FJAT-42376]
MTEPAASTSENRALKKTRHLRMNILFLAVFLVFVLVIVRLGIVQIVRGEEYTKEVSRSETNVSAYPAPRGKMYDRYGRVVVDNIGVPAITYTVDKKTKPEDKIRAVKELSKLIQVESEAIKKIKEQESGRDLRDYWLSAHPKKAKKLLSKKDLKLDGKAQYQLQVKNIPQTEIEKMKMDPQQLSMAVLFKRFSSGYQYEPQIIKAQMPSKDGKTGPDVMLTQDEMARVSENLDKLPGINIITDWDRHYPYGDLLGPLLGKVTSSAEGIPKERMDYFQTRGYSRNDRVGKGYIEMQYEQYLNAAKSKIQYTTDKDGHVSEEVISAGSRGYDLKLTFDMELQKEIDKIIEEEIIKGRRGSGNRLVSSAFAVVMDPNSGDVLSMSGKQFNFKESSKPLDFSYGAFTGQYEMGSVVKGATVLTAYQHGMSTYKSYYDAPMTFKNTATKSSAGDRSLGWVNDIEALKKSSNIYMFKAVIENIAGFSYVENGPFKGSFKDIETLRNGYYQFGLGMETGIDLPNESHGYRTDPERVGQLMDFSIGQLDTYTPLQLAQYVSVIANGGYRIQPRVVKSVHDPISENGIGPYHLNKEPKILNRINNSEAEIKQVQRGFKAVTQTGGTAAGKFPGLDVSGKTGTAQTTYRYPDSKLTEKTYNINFVGYYPSEKPEIAFSVVVPYAKADINKAIASRVVKAYVDLQKKYEETPPETYKEKIE